MDQDTAARIIEALLYMTDHPLSEKEIANILETNSLGEEEIRALVLRLGERMDASQSALQLVSVAGGYQIATRNDVAPFVRRLYKERLTVRLSQSALETLAIISYKQPISRSELEQIRGVEVTGVMETLLERRLIRVVGRKETIGRPLLYGTTSDFLRQFGLKNLAELPDLDSVTPGQAAPPLEMNDLFTEPVAVGVEPASEAATPTEDGDSSVTP